MIFVRTKDQNNIALSDIRSYGYTQGNSVRAIDSNGESHHCEVDEFDRVLFGAIIAAIPAEPGTFFLTGVTDTDGSARTWDRDPVIAWGVKADGGVIALGTDGADHVNRAILLPSGTVTAAFGSWNSVDEYTAQADD